MQSAFDTLAPTYDDDFTNTQIGQWLRAQVHKRLLSHWQVGDHILELGCGTGEDALFLAEHGIQVTATDASESMRQVAQEKTSNQPLITITHLDLHNLPDTAPHTYDGVLSNFGVLNCLSDWHPLSEWLAQRVPQGGIVGLGIMAPYCIWETFWHGIHLNFKVATRRFRGKADFQQGDETITITYPHPNKMIEDFTEYFHLHHLQPLGLFLPPSDVYNVIEKHPRLLKWLTNLETKYGDKSPLSKFADHYWIEFKRR